MLLELMLKDERKEGREEGFLEGRRDGIFEGGPVQIAASGVAHQSRGGGRQEEQQVDALGRPLVDVQEEGHHQQQQCAAAHAPGGEDAGPQTAEEGKDPVCHSRYFTPA